MIKPVNGSISRTVFGQSSNRYRSATKGLTPTSKTAMYNAGGVAAAVGGLTTALSRGYTSSWLTAAILGFCGAALSLFFMTPQLIEKCYLEKPIKKAEADVFISDASKTAKKQWKPLVKKAVQFKQS